jgi:hypothetical protein
LHIYGLTPCRDEATINRFIDTFVDRDEAEAQLSDEALSLEPMGRKRHATQFLSEPEPALSLANVVKRGLDYPRRSFTVYLPQRRKDLHLENRVTVTFTIDNQVIFGLRMRDTEKNVRRAKKELLPSLIADYKCEMGIVAVEFWPPSSESEFRESKDIGLVLYFREGSLEIVR